MIKLKILDSSATNTLAAELLNSLSVPAVVPVFHVLPHILIIFFATSCHALRISYSLVTRVGFGPTTCDLRGRHSNH